MQLTLVHLHRVEWLKKKKLSWSNLLKADTRYDSGTLVAGIKFLFISDTKYRPDKSSSLADFLVWHRSEE